MKTLIEVLQSEVSDYEDGEGDVVVKVDLGTLESDQEFANDNVVESLKRQLVFEQLINAAKNFKNHGWARSCLQQSIRKAYILKEKFSPEQQDKLAEVLTGLKNANANQNAYTIGHLKIDAGIKSNPLDNNQGYVDGRQTRLLITDTASKWATKQDF